ncbi:unnamed protein product [Amoebophrya sp. A25]|nr:unnamed protein product [Amoebophrya sp. A25]|eukprot:GSA25T00014122001.1
MIDSLEWNPRLATRMPELEDNFDDLFGVEPPEECLAQDADPGVAGRGDAKRRKTGRAPGKHVESSTMLQQKSSIVEQEPDAFRTALEEFDGDRLTALSEEALASFNTKSARTLRTATTFLKGGKSNKNNKGIKDKEEADEEVASCSSASSKQIFGDDVASVDGGKAPSTTHSLFSGYAGGMRGGGGAGVYTDEVLQGSTSCAASKAPGKGKGKGSTGKKRCVKDEVEANSCVSLTKIRKSHFAGSSTANVHKNRQKKSSSSSSAEESEHGRVDHRSTSSSSRYEQLEATNNMNSTSSSKYELEATSTNICSSRPPIVAPRVHNCVASFEMRTKINLQDACFKARNIEYNGKKSHSLIVRLQEPRAAGLVYEHGRVMITGAKSPDEAKLAGKKIAKLFQAIGYKDARFVNYQLVNLVAIADLGFPVRLERVAFDYQGQASYEPELFSGLVWKQWDPQVSVLIFVSGKIVMTGTKSPDDLYAVLDELYPKLAKYQK